MDSREQIEQTAADWIARRDSGIWTTADQAELDRWTQASTWHLVAFLRLEAMWKEVARAKALGAGFKAGIRPTTAELRASPYFSSIPGPGSSVGHEPVFEVSPRDPAPAAPHAIAQVSVAENVDPSGQMRRLSVFSAAAAILLAVALFVWNRGLLNRPNYSTPVGGIASVPMVDGSTVTLNTDSQIRLEITKMERRVDLEHGEAFFKVAKDAGRPFVVHAGDKRVLAVGTQFSVRRDGQDIRVVVTEGKVRVEETQGGSDMPAIELVVGSIARAGRSGVSVQASTLLEAEKLLSWRSGYLAFHETPLIEAAAEFNRYNARKIVVDDPSVAGIQIGGNFRAASVEAFIRLLENDFPVHIEQRGDRIVLTHSSVGQARSR